MSKLGEAGKPIIDPVTKKIMKPAGWEANHKPEPLIEKELNRQIEAAKRKRVINMNSDKFKREQIRLAIDSVESLALNSDIYIKEVIHTYTEGLHGTKTINLQVTFKR